MVSFFARGFGLGAFFGRWFGRCGAVATDFIGDGFDCWHVFGPAWVAFYAGTGA